MFKINELIKAVHGRLILGRGNALVRGVSIDSRTIKRGNLFIAITGHRFDGHDFVEEAIEKGAQAVIVDRKIERIHKPNRVCVIRVKNTTKALADIAAYNRKNFNIPVIGIAGTNGKTTTKEMIAWILNSAFKVLKNPGTQNNQIGLPLTLLKLNKGFDVVVLEMGTNHFGEIGYLAKIAKPTIGIINNIGPAHLEFFKNLEGVYREKSSLINNLITPAIAILNMDDRFLRRNLKDKDKFVVSFGINNSADYKASKIKIGKRKKNSIKFLLNSKYVIRLNTLGFANVYNALAAISVARLLGMGYNMIVQRLSNFVFPGSRLNLVNRNNINFIDDTYNSNPSSLEEALETLDNFKIRGRKIFIMGDMLELGSHKQVFHQLAGKRVAQVCDILIAVGELTKLTAREALRAGLEAKHIFNCDYSKEAKNILLNKINPNRNDLVLVKGSRSMQMEEVIR